jgi:hypothetical protein
MTIFHQRRFGLMGAPVRIIGSGPQGVASPFIAGLHAQRCAGCAAFSPRRGVQGSGVAGSTARARPRPASVLRSPRRRRRVTVNPSCDCSSVNSGGDGSVIGPLLNGPYGPTADDPVPTSIPRLPSGLPNEFTSSSGTPSPSASRSVGHRGTGSCLRSAPTTGCDGGRFESRLRSTDSMAVSC